jgi:oxygen-independent coproporphyrinogen-3 oxidase
MHILASEGLKLLGKIQDPADWYIDKEFAYSHQQDKWNLGRDLVAVGPDVYWRLNGYAGYNLGIFEYIKAINEGKRPLGYFMKLSKEEEMAQKAVFGIKTKRGINKEAFRERFGLDFLDVYSNEVKKLENLGLVINDKDAVRPTDAGMLFADEIALEFRTKGEKEFYERMGISKYHNTP